MNRDLRITEKSQIGYEILAHLVEHPEARDTLDGILEWWLLERKIEHGIARVKEALAELVSKGLILDNEGRDSRVHYRLNQSKYKEILTLIKQRPDDMQSPMYGKS